MNIVAWGVEHNGMVVDAYPTQTEARLMCKHLDKARPVPLCQYTPVTSHAGDLFQALRELVGLAKMGAAPLSTYKAAVQGGDQLIKDVERQHGGQ
ncbi:hypothetical protein MLC59_01940 [Marinobacter bryozoorum]|uniref:hypothetical protein n=1 Tax=Marinobacter bryozoorum TaxID=256324 RepID=UPI002003DC96|nr:hypothetical protein [Marinobacter bryozoorum]MCK7542931.1 hypothetical protein [Marinobacter bryozoorum]